MGLVSYFMNPLPLSVVFNAYVAFFLPIITYFLFTKNFNPLDTSKMPPFLKEILVIILVGWLTSTWLAIYSTMTQCGTFSMLWTMLIGLITPAFMLLGFILVKYLLPFLQKPAGAIFGWISSPMLKESAITGFYMALLSWMGSIITHFKATDEGCRLTRNSLKKFRAEMTERREKIHAEENEDTKEPETVQMK